MLGEKIRRKAQVLGQKITRKARVLGEKANLALKQSDVGLRKAQNFIKNRAVPIAASINPELGAAAIAGLGGVTTVRNLVNRGQRSINDLEKLNIRKKLEEIGNENLGSSFA